MNRYSYTKHFFIDCIHCGGIKRCECLLNVTESTRGIPSITFTDIQMKEINTYTALRERREEQIKISLLN